MELEDIIESARRLAIAADHIHIQGGCIFYLLAITPCAEGYEWSIVALEDESTTPKVIKDLEQMLDNLKSGRLDIYDERSQGDVEQN